jgi:hypothetical protein
MKALLVLSALILFTAPAHASETCKFHLYDVTKETLSASGKTLIDAQAQAAVKCFDMHEELSLRNTGHKLYDDEAGVTVANTCTNIRCGS